MSQKWSISRRQGVCAVTGRPFADGERHVSVLELAGGELERRDMTLDAWRAREAEGAAEPLVWWVTQHRAGAARTVRMDLDALERLFVAMEGRAEPSVRELRYLLCLLLMRKRRVALDRVERGPEGERMLVKRPRRDERFEVFVADFTPERMDEMRAELQAIFDGAEDEPEGGIAGLAGIAAGSSEAAGDPAGAEAADGGRSAVQGGD